MGCRVESSDVMKRKIENGLEMQEEMKRAQGKRQVDCEREGRDIMKETGRLIHIQRQKSPKRLRDTKQLVQLTVCPTFWPSILLYPLYRHLSISLDYPHPLVIVSTTSCCHVNNTPTSCSSIRACILSYLPACPY